MTANAAIRKYMQDRQPVQFRPPLHPNTLDHNGRQTMTNHNPQSDWFQSASPLQQCGVCGESVYQCQCPNGDSTMENAAYKAIDKHAKRLNIDEQGHQWGRHILRQALANNLRESDAILHAMNEMDLWIELRDSINDTFVDQLVRDSGMEAHHD